VQNGHNCDTIKSGRKADLFAERFEIERRPLLDVLVKQLAHPDND
jgi:hypothetical protein